MVYMFFLCSFFCIFHAIAAQEFIYPVGYTRVNEELFVYLIYQKNNKKIELYSWSPLKKKLRKSLSSRFNPSNFSLIPGNFGFSFVDSGIIWLKSFVKRSPKTLNVQDSIYAHEYIQWLDEFSFFLSAKKNNHFALFRGDITGKCKVIISSLESDYIYPCYFNKNIFFIKKKPLGHIFSNKYKYFLEKINIDNFSKASTFLVDLGQNTILFLHMASEQEGFFVEYVESEQKSAIFITFDYIHIKKMKTVWKRKKLFSFALPRQCETFFQDMSPFKLSDSFTKDHPFLFESFFRLCPLYSKEECGVYFTDFSPHYTLNVFFFNCKTKKIIQISQGKNGEHFFSPLIVEGKVFYGGKFDSKALFRGDENLITPPFFFEDLNAEVLLEIPIKNYNYIKKEYKYF